jgi:cell division protein FtsN
MGQTMNKQRGGTLLGVIIGALLGLGAALAVAVYVTKVPVPFLNKGQSHSAESDAQEAKKNKDWDPNAPLAGKSAARPAPAASGAAATDAAVGPVVGAASPAKTAAVSPAPAAPTVPAKPSGSNDPLGDLAKARASAKAELPKTSTGSGVDPFSYFIQVGAFRTPEDAEQQRAKLSLLGFQAKVSEREQYGRTVYRVRLGPFDKKDEADKTKEKLDGNAVETALVRVQR